MIRSIEEAPLWWLGRGGLVVGFLVCVFVFGFAGFVLSFLWLVGWLVGLAFVGVGIVVFFVGFGGARCWKCRCGLTGF